MKLICFAATLIFSQSIQASPIIDQQNIQVDPENSAWGFNKDLPIAQSITFSVSGKLTEVDFDIATNYDGFVGRVSVRKSLDEQPIESVVMPFPYGNYVPYLTAFYFQDVAVHAGETLYFTFESALDTAAMWGHARGYTRWPAAFPNAPQDTYTSGDIYRRTDGIWGPGSLYTGDLAFTSYVDPVSTAYVPEAGTLALTSLGLFGIFRTRRKVSWRLKRNL